MHLHGCSGALQHVAFARRRVQLAHEQVMRYFRWSFACACEQEVDFHRVGQQGQDSTIATSLQLLYSKHVSNAEKSWEKACYVLKFRQVSECTLNTRTRTAAVLHQMVLTNEDPVLLLKPQTFCPGFTQEGRSWQLFFLYSFLFFEAPPSACANMT